MGYEYKVGFTTVKPTFFFRCTKKNFAIDHILHRCHSTSNATGLRLSNVTHYYTYNSDGQVITKTTQRQGVTTYAYENGLPTRITDPEGVVYTLGYDLAGRLISISDGDNNTTTLAYDGVNRLTSVTDPLNHRVSMVYDGSDNLIRFTDANGNITQRSYDANGNIVSQINALGQETRYEYLASERLYRVIDAKGGVTQLEYDPKGRLVSIINPLGQTQTLEYDAADNLLKRFDAFGKRVMSLNIDQLNNPISVTDALSNRSTFDYDVLNRLVQTSDPVSAVTQFRYDDLNRLVESVDALTGVSSQSFDADGNRDSIEDANNHETRFDFDLSGRLVQETLATGDKVSYTYSARDLLASVTNGRELERQFEYDPAGRLTRWTGPSDTVSYSYDANGNVLTVTDRNGTITREYDPLNRVTQYTDTQGNTLQYFYDSVGNLVALTYPDGKQVAYEYNAASQLIKVTDWAGRETHYEYDLNGRLIKVLRPNNTQLTRVYDDAGQLVQQKEVVISSGELISQFDFVYDAAGDIVQEKIAPEPNIEVEPFEMTYGASNRLATHNGEAVQFDADGNMVFGPLAGEMANFVFDSRNRLVATSNTAYRYDAENQRLGVSVDEQETRYVINSQPLLSQVLVRTQPDGTQTYYVYGLGLIGQEQDGVYLTYHFDLRGSTVALTDETGIVTERFQYSLYGLLMSGDASTTPFLFNGMYGVMTDGNGLYYMRARYYNPEIRRFVNQDILLGSVAEGQTLNRYAYVNGNPVLYIDPEGKIAWVGVLIGIGVWFGTEVLIQPDVPPGLEDDAIAQTTFPDFGISTIVGTSKLTTKACSGQLAQKFKDWWNKGANKNDEIWNSLTLKEQFLYEMGQKTLKGSKYAKYADIADPIERGRKILEENRWAWLTITTEPNAWKATLPTGGTPGVRKYWWIGIGAMGTGAAAGYGLNKAIDWIIEIFE
jgi:RHS repeat-associated protein